MHFVPEKQVSRHYHDNTYCKSLRLLQIAVQRYLINLVNCSFKLYNIYGKFIPLSVFSLTVLIHTCHRT